MLGVDAMARIIHRHSTRGDAVIVRGLADAAMFADYTSNALFGVGPFKNTWQYEALAVNSDIQVEKTSNNLGRLDYAQAMRAVFSWMNISNADDIGCVRYRQAQRKDEGDCMFTENLILHIHTPVFLVQVQLFFTFSYL